MPKRRRKKTSPESTIHLTFEDNLSNIAADNIKRKYFFSIWNINALDSSVHVTLNTLVGSYINV